MLSAINKVKSEEEVYTLELDFDKLVNLCLSDTFILISELISFRFAIKLILKTVKLSCTINLSDEFKHILVHFYAGLCLHRSIGHDVFLHLTDGVFVLSYLTFREYLFDFWISQELQQLHLRVL